MSKNKKVGRPKGTTKARGYKVSTGRPKKEDWFMRRITKMLIKYSALRSKNNKE